LTNNTNSSNIELTEKQLQSMKQTLIKGDRVELIPTKDGVKIVKVKRETIK